MLRNSFVLPVIEKAFGTSARLQALTSDCNVYGSVRQPPHRDISHRQAGKKASSQRRPVVLLANVALQDVGEEDGPMELWPGTQAYDMHGIEDSLTSTPEDGANDEAESVCSLLPSVRMRMQAGDILIRNPMMIHRGTPRRRAGVRLLATAIYKCNDFDGEWNYLNVRNHGGHPKRGFDELSDDARNLLPINADP